MSLNTLTDITNPRGPHNFDIRCYDLYVDGAIIGGVTGSTPTDFNYATTDPGNDKINIFGLCKNFNGGFNGGFTGQTVLAVDSFGQYLHYQDALNNIINITNNGAIGENEIISGKQGSYHIPLKLFQNQNTISMSDNALNLEKDTGTHILTVELDAGSVLIENQTVGNSISAKVEVTPTLILQEISNSLGELTRTALTNEEYKVIVPNSGTTGGIIFSLDTSLATPTVNLTIADNLINNSSLVQTADEVKLQSNYGGVFHKFAIDQGVFKLTNLPLQPATEIVTVNQITGALGYAVGSSVQSLTLLGNPVHAFVNNTGALQYRGIVSPLNTITYNVTPTNIEMDVNFPPILPMNPQILGSSFGFQDQGSLINNLGYNNNATLTRSNVIAQDVPNSLSGDKSNVICSANTLQSTNNIMNSNVFISSDTSELGNVNRSNIVAQGLNNNINYEQCTYVGDMLNTQPSDLSTCFNNNQFGENIVMNTQSVYFGSGATPLTVNTNEFHFDYKCPNWFYHDLQQGSSTNILYFDPVSHQILHSVLPVSPTGPTGPIGTPSPQGTPTDGFSAFLSTAIINQASSIIFPNTATPFVTNVNSIIPAVGLNSGIINLSTGLISPFFSARCLLTVNINYTNNSASAISPDSMSIYLWNVGQSKKMAGASYVITTNDGFNYSFSSVVFLGNTNTYQIRMDTSLPGNTVVSSGPNTQISLQRLTLT